MESIRLVDEKNSYGVPAMPSGFPLYLFPLRSKRMPLQSLTREALQNLMALPILINKVYFFCAPTLTLTLTFSEPIRVIRVCKKSGLAGTSRSDGGGKRQVSVGPHSGTADVDVMPVAPHSVCCRD